MFCGDNQALKKFDPIIIRRMFFKRKVLRVDATKKLADYLLKTRKGTQ
jgi:hypothetical protein